MLKVNSSNLEVLELFGSVDFTLIYAVFLSRCYNGGEFNSIGTRGEVCNG